MGKSTKLMNFHRTDGNQDCKKEEIITGPATIRCFVDNEVREFDIEVTQVDMMSQEINKGLVIKVTDEELLEKQEGLFRG